MVVTAGFLPNHFELDLRIRPEPGVQLWRKYGPSEIGFLSG